MDWTRRGQKRTWEEAGEAIQGEGSGSPFSQGPGPLHSVRVLWLTAAFCTGAGGEGPFCAPGSRSPEGRWWLSGSPGPGRAARSFPGSPPPGGAGEPGPLGAPPDPVPWEGDGIWPESCSPRRGLSRVVPTHSVRSADAVTPGLVTLGYFPQKVRKRERNMPLFVYSRCLLDTGSWSRSLGGACLCFRLRDGAASHPSVWGPGGLGGGGSREGNAREKDLLFAFCRTSVLSPGGGWHRPAGVPPGSTPGSQCWEPRGLGVLGPRLCLPHVPERCVRPWQVASPL